MAPQPALLRLQTVTKVLAGAWAQALADASWQLDSLERGGGSSGGGAHADRAGGHSAAHHEALALYSRASMQHEVRNSVERLLTWQMHVMHAGTKLFFCILASFCMAFSAHHHRPHLCGPPPTC